jgi:hypothetical protein
MGRRRMTEAEHRLKGTFEKNPDREAHYKAIPKPKGPVGDPPKSFDAAMVEIWNEITDQAPPGVLTLSDRLHVEMTCRLTQRIRTNQGTSGDYARLEVALGKMGMNPSDRCRINLGNSPAAAVSKNGEAETGNTFESIRNEAEPSRLQ